MKDNKKKALIICAIVVIIGIALILWTLPKNKSYAVTFDSNGGSAVDTQSVKDTATKPTDPTREGYEFVGWFLNLDDETPYDFSKKVNGNITLKAKWAKGSSKETCTLTCKEGYELVNPDSANCSCKKVSKTDDKTTKITLNKSSLSLTVGQKYTVKATVTPSSKSNSVKWTTSNKKVATVSNGKITAVSKGTALITATVDGKTATVKVTVKVKSATKPTTPTEPAAEEKLIDKAVASMAAKTLTKGNTSINYTYSGCTITNTANEVSSNAKKTVVSAGNVSKLYRPASNGTIKSTYKVVCDSDSKDVTLTHTISASTYKYTATNNGMVWQIAISGLNSNGTLTGTEKCTYNSSWGYCQMALDKHKAGTVYELLLNSDSNTIYEVKSN